MPIHIKKVMVHPYKGSLTCSSMIYSYTCPRVPQPSLLWKGRGPSLAPTCPRVPQSSLLWKGRGVGTELLIPKNNTASLAAEQVADRH